MRRLLLVLLLTSSSTALAIGFDVDAAGGFWIPSSPQFQLRLGVRQHLAKLGERVSLVGTLHGGVFLHTAGTRLGVPVDLALELHVGPVQFGVVGGPWFHFNDGDVVRAHLGGEFGVRFAKHFRVTLEAGWLQPAPLVLLRFGVTF
ncbi:MAG: hypothetical protein JNJ54_25580 [Myxococcaceae bacterium]|nr:hypothetical protein [Myxococcaceae bacterium]